MTIYWTSEDCHGQAILTLHLSVGQVIIFPYFDHCKRCFTLLRFENEKKHSNVRLTYTLTNEQEI